ncbi:helix-turn-helix domain-containing protein [bacterium]|nr:MAG: helix-turn-helix domain-containing protein [bacterium]
MKALTASFKDSPTDDSLLSFSEALRLLDTSKSTLYRLLAQEEIKGVKVGKQWRFRKGDLSAYLGRGPVVVVAESIDAGDFATEFAWLEREGVPSAGAETVESKVAGLVDGILHHALAAEASDLHLDPTDEGLRVRYRIDGVMREIRRMPLSLHEPVVASLKERAGMSPTERRLPQDGRTHIHVNGATYDLRMNVIPTIRGESVVVRLFGRAVPELGLTALGAVSLDALRPFLLRPGLILVAGPARSGKTTLLYSCLREIDAEANKILTVEEPVELRLPGVVQTQVGGRPELTFVALMRTCLRQDPDVLLCGALRDRETMEVALRAAQSGTLVIAGIFAEDAPGAVKRLIELGADPHVLSGALRAVVETRLVRRLDPAERVLDTETPPEVIGGLKTRSEKGGYSIPDSAAFYTPPRNCARGAGYRGRIGLYAVVPVTPPMIHEIIEGLSVEGGSTLLAEGMRRAVARETSLEEVLRATDGCA